MRSFKNDVNSDTVGQGLIETKFSAQVFSQQLMVQKYHAKGQSKHYKESSVTTRSNSTGIKTGWATEL